MIALALGGARSVWSDLAAAEDLLAGRPRLTIACNDAGQHFTGRLDAWATLHPEKLPRWRKGRQGNSDYRVFSHLDHAGARDLELVPETWPGSSGLYMAQVALARLDCDGVILCGVPLDPEQEHFHSEGEWKAADGYRRGFLRAFDEVPESIRSMSGWTADLFGRPSSDWLARTA